MDAETRRLFVDHVKEVELLALGGDEFAIKTLACMALLIDPTPSDDGGGEPVIDLAAWRLRLAA